MEDRNKLKSKLFILAMVGRMYSVADEWQKRGGVAGYNEEDFALTLKSYAVAVVEELDEWLKQPHHSKE